MAVEAPAFHDIDLVCEIYNETTLNQYNQDLKRWESNIQKKWEAFEIDDDEYKECLRSGTLDENDKHPSSQGLFHQGSTLQMCKTLPPVLVNYELDESNVDRTRRLRANAKKQQNTRPQMPIPELLHLAFTARTLVYNEYLDLCTNTSDLEKFFIDTCLGKIYLNSFHLKLLFSFLGGDYRSKTSQKRLKKFGMDSSYAGIYTDDQDELNTNINSRITLNEEEADLLRITLSDLLRSLLSDRVFADTLPQMISETTPYFSQLKYNPTPRSIEQQQQQQVQDNRLLKDYQTRLNVDENQQERSYALLSADQEHLGISTGELVPKAHIIKRTFSTPSTLSDLDQNLDDAENLKNNPNVTALVEDIIENTLWNILQEAYHNEFSLTARPRLIALPPKRQPSIVTSTNIQVESNPSIFPSPPLILTESFD